MHLKRWTLIPAALLAACASSNAIAPPAATVPEAELSASAQVARDLVSQLAARQFELAHARFAEPMANSLSAAVLGQQWDAMTANLGAFQRAQVVREEPRAEGSRAVVAECQYEKDSLGLLVILDANQQVTGLRPSPLYPREAFEKAGRDFLQLLIDREWSTARKRFDENMSKLVSREALAESFNALRRQYGEVREVLNVRLIPVGSGMVVDLECAYEKLNGKVRVSFDKKLRVNGYHFLPAWNPPEYADPTAFEEREVTFGTEKFPLPGTLTMPKGEGPFPAVVLVHGSGPNDRDESMGPNKLFKDLAWGLAARKIAVLRYDKRTHHYKGKLSNDDIATVKEESIDDAIEAVALLSRTPGIDPKRIFVAGHSLGAYVAPRVAKADSRVRGIVLLAGNTRPMGKLHLDQIIYLAPIWTQSPEKQQELIAQAKQVAARLDAPDLKPDEIVDGIPGRYWLDMRENVGAAIASSLEVPMLVLQGERDYQVTMEDFEGWKQALSGKPNATLKSYPKLNHHFMPGEGASTPVEYEQPNHVPLAVIDDLAQWFSAH
ncbi:MAG: alpha/beta fold hydrolase [Myxococcales bacterium]|jgi:dienelactone hydrolase